MGTPAKQNGHDLAKDVPDAKESDSLKEIEGVGYPPASPPGKEYEAKFTTYVFFTTVVAAGAGVSLVDDGNIYSFALLSPGQLQGTNLLLPSVTRGRDLSSHNPVRLSSARLLD